MSAVGQTVEAYDQKIPSVKDYFKKGAKNPVDKAKDYVISLFPILQWIYRYNLTWLYGDLIAGLTVGIVVVPQGMSYAKIASLSPEYGLYASFVGVFIYCFFATSKDVSIGPVAVMSLQVGRTIIKVTEKYPQYANDGPLIGITLSLLCGAVALGLGLLRLGFILEFIPIPAVMGFMTGSAFSIVVGQIPGLFGVSKRLDTRAATYQVFIDFWKNIKYSNIDAAFGLISLFFLFLFKYVASYGEKRAPKYKVYFFYVGVLRNGLIIVFATLISWGCYRHSEKPAASLIKTVPSGLRHVGVPTVNREIINALAPELPVSVIVLLLEHIAISKSFGRVNNYKIVPNQELIAIGVTNLIGTFFSAYPATGSFSRSALKAKCGVRTPLAGIFTGAVVLLALYAFTDAFYWIPNATLCAIIIHAVYDLMANPKTSYKVWTVSPIEAAIFIIAVFITVFVTIEAGIYFSICASAAFLLFRIAKAKGEFLGRIEYFEVINPTITGNINVEPNSDYLVKTKSNISNQNLDNGGITEEISDNSVTASNKSDGINEKTAEIISVHKVNDSRPSSVSPSNPNIVKRYKWVPLELHNLNPKLRILPPPPGVVVFRPNESFTYPNCSRQVDFLYDEVQRVTRRGNPNKISKLGDRPWNDHGPRHRKENTEDDRPILRDVILDFSSVPQLDLTGIQNLVDISKAINRYADREVEFHFVGIISSWARRALVAEGFGTGSPEKSVVGVTNSYFTYGFEGEAEETRVKIEDEESSIGKEEESRVSTSNDDYLVPLIGTNTPFFHSEIPNLE